MQSDNTQDWRRLDNNARQWATFQPLAVTPSQKKAAGEKCLQFTPNWIKGGFGLYFLFLCLFYFIIFFIFLFVYYYSSVCLQCGDPLSAHPLQNPQAMPQQANPYLTGAGYANSPRVPGAVQGQEIWTLDP